MAILGLSAISLLIFVAAPAVRVTTVVSDCSMVAMFKSVPERVYDETS